MKLFITVFFAILAAAVVILGALWAKARVDAWETAWRSCEAQAWMYAQHTSPDTSGMSPTAVIDVLSSHMKRIKDDTVELEKLERQAIAILEQKPFGLPLTTAEQQELTMLKQDADKAAAWLRDQQKSN